MGLLTEGYNLAMERYRSILMQQELLGEVQSSSSLPETANNGPSISESSDTKNNTFNELITDAVANISSGKTYNVGGYNISIPSLSDTNVLNRIKNNNIDSIVTMASEKYNVPEALIYKIIETESYFNTSAVSGAGASGLMQIMPFNYSSLGITDASDPYQNIMGGVKLLKQYLNMYDGDVKLGLAAYNAGPGNVNKYGGVPPFEETQNYIKKILGA